MWRSDFPSSGILNGIGNLHNPGSTKAACSDTSRAQMPRCLPIIAVGEAILGSVCFYLNNYVADGSDSKISLNIPKWGRVKSSPSVVMVPRILSAHIQDVLDFGVYSSYEYTKLHTHTQTSHMNCLCHTQIPIGD